MFILIAGDGTTECNAVVLQQTHALDGINTG